MVHNRNKLPIGPLFLMAGQLQKCTFYNIANTIILKYWVAFRDQSTCTENMHCHHL